MDHSELVALACALALLGLFLAGAVHFGPPGLWPAGAAGITLDSGPVQNPGADMGRDP